MPFVGARVNASSAAALLFGAAASGLFVSTLAMGDVTDAAAAAFEGAGAAAAGRDAGAGAAAVGEVGPIRVERALIIALAPPFRGGGGGGGGGIMFCC